MNDRPRTIIKEAASQTGVTAVKAWLIMDEQGTWERRVKELLGKVERAQEADDPEVVDLSDKDVNSMIANRILGEALQAVERATQKAAG